MSLTATFVFIWPIPCANWSNLSQFSNIPFITINYKQMWKPIVMHYNSVNNYYLNPDDLSLPYVVVSSGIAAHYMVGIFTSKCDFHFKRFPFDSHKCDFILESFSKKELVVFQTMDIVYHPQNDVVGDFIFDYSKVQVYNRNRTTPTGVYSFAVYEFYFSRKSEYYVINIILPIISMMTLEHAALMIPISPDRCSFLLTILLSIFLIQSVVDSTISHLSETPRLAYFLLSFTVSSTILCLYSITMLMLRKGKLPLLKKKMKLKCFRIKFIRCCDRIVLMLSVLSSVAMAAFTFQERE